MSKKVLIIDDDIDVVEAMKIALESVGYEVESAGESEEGLEKLLEFKPDLVILDVMMTTITEGFNAAWEIRSPEDGSRFKDFRNIPILMISAVSSEQKMLFDPEKDEDFLPVNEFVEKPIAPRHLIKKVQELIG
ncbi:MAG: response regulator [Candidatus Fermentibacteria bacterium]